MIEAKDSHSGYTMRTLSYICAPSLHVAGRVFGAKVLPPPKHRAEDTRHDTPRGGRSMPLGHGSDYVPLSLGVMAECISLLFSRPQTQKFLQGIKKLIDSIVILGD